jgi:hypothetical protein
MGHDLPRSLLPRLAEEIAAHCHGVGATMVVNSAGEVRL